MPEEFRTCGNCHQVLPAKAFYSRASSAAGMQGVCKKCQNYIRLHQPKLEPADAVVLARQGGRCISCGCELPWWHVIKIVDGKAYCKRCAPCELDFFLEDC